MATSFNNPTSDNLTGFQHDTSKNVTLRSASGSPLSHTALDQNWSRLGSAINNIHGFFAQRDSAINSLENSQLTLAELPVATSSTQGIASVDTTAQGGLIVTNGKIGVNNTTLTSSIDARIASEIQSDNSVDLSSINSEWTWLTTPYEPQFVSATTNHPVGQNISVNSNNIRDPEASGWKFAQIIGLGGVPSTARQVLATLSLSELVCYIYNPAVGIMNNFGAYAPDNTSTNNTNLIIHAGSAPWPLFMGGTRKDANPNNIITKPEDEGAMTASTHAVMFFWRVDDNGGTIQKFRILAYR